MATLSHHVSRHVGEKLSKNIAASITVTEHLNICRSQMIYVSMRFQSTSAEDPATTGQATQSQEFRELNIPGIKKDVFKKKFRMTRKEVPPPRYKKMPTNQDWTNVWPAAHTFKWSVVPFPVRQGMIQNLTENDGLIPGKYANAELMKIPNFLHLTPAHIKKHCAAIKKFCTDWPEALNTEEKCDKHFPLSIKTCDYLTSGPSLRDVRSRVVKMKINLSDLELDYHARDKLIRLAGDKYNAKKDILYIESDRCPTKKQNEDYLKFVLTALFHESWKIEDWESQKEESDWEQYFWDLAQSKKEVVDLVQRMKTTVQSKNLDDPSNLPSYLDKVNTEEEILTNEVVQDYKIAISDLINAGENDGTLKNYKDSVVNLLHAKL